MTGKRSSILSLLYQKFTPTLLLPLLLLFTCWRHELEVVIWGVSTTISRGKIMKFASCAGKNEAGMSLLPQCTALVRISRGFIIVSSRWSEIHIQPLPEIAVWLPLFFLCHTSSCHGQFCDPGDCPRIPLRWPLLYLKCAVLEVWCRWICVHLQARVCSDCLMLQQKYSTFLIPRQV